MSTGSGSKAIIAALLSNLGIALTKFVAFLVTGFSSMLAESIHSFADTGNQILLLFGGKSSRREATEEHPLGYGRERFFWAFIVSIILFTLGGLYSIYEAYEKFHHVLSGERSEVFESPWRYLPLAVLGVSILLESFSLRTAIIESNQVRGGRGWWQFIREAKAPELPVVLLEDVAAITGLILATLAVGLTLLTHNEIYDAIGTACIGVLLLVVAVILAREMKSLLIGESALPEVQSNIVEAIERTDGVTGVIHIKTVHIGPETLLVAAKIGIESTAHGDEIARLIDAAENSLREAEPMARYVYLEPDLKRDGAVDGV